MQDMRIGDVDKRLSRFLHELKTSYRDVYTELYVMDGNGQVIASSTPENIGNRISEREGWVATRYGGTAINLASLDRSLLPISATVEDSISGLPLGTLVAVFNWEQVRLILENAIAGRGAAALWAGKQNLLSQTASWPAMQDSPTLSAAAIANGYQGFPGFDWQVEIAQQQSQALAPIRHMGAIFFVILAVTVLLASLIVMPVATSITRPLARLTQFANNFMRTPSSTLPPSGGPAEVEMMANAFGKMITDLERSKEDLMRAAKLAVAGEMAAAMSHEVRTPLGILRSSAQVLLREPGLSEEAREVCGFIVSETERLNKLVSTLIDSARPRKPELLATDITALIRQTVAMLKMQAERKNIALSLEGDGPAYAYCDVEQITQVLLNLLLNAIQVLPEGGRITIQVAQTPERVVTTIADNGPGIPQGLQEKIFDPFFTLREGGIGLGLAVVRQIVIAHHGTIHASNNEAGGAEFRLQLPLATSSDA